MRGKFIRPGANSTLLRYGVALACTLVALVLTLQLFNVLYPNLFHLFLIAIVISAGYGGFWPGALATALSVVSIILISPDGWVVSGVNDVRLVFFMLISLLISWLSGALHRSLAAIRERETWFREIFEGSRDAIFLVEKSARFVEVNRAACELTGYSRQELLSMSVPDLHDEADLEAFLTYFASIMDGADVVTEALLRRKDGLKVAVEFSNRRMSFRGKLVMHTTAQDITERKQAEKAREQLLKDREQLLRQLVTAQEEERRRIALELHDQLGQQITALMLGLKRLRDSGHCPPPASAQLGQLQEYADQLGREVHNIAWELRPTALDDLGLQMALSNYLEKWSERTGKRVEIHSDGFNGHRLSPQIETTLYRVIQEALTNVVKHSHAECVSLILEQRDGHVRAIVEDDGCGFNVDEVINAPESERKLGLLGMRERLALVFGTLDVESAPGAGTTIFVRIPTPRTGGEEATR